MRRAASHRDWGVGGATAGFAGVPCAGFAPPVWAAVAAFAGSGAVPEPATPEPWPKAGAVASIMAMATIVVFRMSIKSPRPARRPARRELAGRPAWVDRLCPLRCETVRRTGLVLVRRDRI